MTFKGDFIVDDSRWALPYIEEGVLYTELTGGAAADTVTFGTALPTPSWAAFGALYVPTGYAWTVGGGSSTALGFELGDGTDADAYMTTADLVGAGAGWSAAGGPGASAGFASMESSITPVMTFTASGGTPDIDHVDAGRLTCRLYYVAMPSTLPAPTA